MLFNLYVTFFKISALTLGGGAVMLPFMDEEFVEKKKWLTEGEMVDIYALTNSLPGTIAFNASLLIGRKIKGFAGALCSVLGVMTPPILIIILIAEGLSRMSSHPLVEAAFTGVRAGVTALLLLVMIKIGLKTFQGLREVLLALFAFLLVEVLELNAVMVILICAGIGFFLFWGNGE